MVDFSILLLTQGFNSALKIAEITGFIESSNVKIEKLINTGASHSKQKYFFPIYSLFPVP
ncbi:MAG: hypothetical protein F6K54_19135 [Okeania sp. SIO3B5]|uniref:hypothetical protein n=1 Tax=Okeania sp. SIO3B5 TaxID=2607811 RepID=UPI0013FE8B45|nr:hypothetical protein [Okeania sp. SIO3B5]NEO55002.1 hypothetical protein [Okeania sp. SIO3B5]